MSYSSSCKKTDIKVTLTLSHHWHFTEMHSFYVTIHILWRKSPLHPIYIQSWVLYSCC